MTTNIATNDNAAPKAKRAKLELPNFVATLVAQSMKIADTSAGKPYIALQGCELTLPNGSVVTRTVMAFDDAYDAIRAAINSEPETVATLQNMGSTMKVVGVRIGGEMVMFEDPKAAKAA